VGRRLAEFDTKRAAVFDAMAEWWDQRVIPPRPELLSELLDSVGVDGKTVLDVGSGTGVLLSAAMHRKPSIWIACDLSERMLEVLRAKYGHSMPSLVTLRADAHSLPLDDGSVDVAICNGVYPHFHDKRRALEEIHRVLRPSGSLIINHFVSRETVNSIHLSSENEVLRADLLPPATELASLLTSIGFVVSSCTDTGELYRVTAVLPATGER
jgi:ubiquinone/menaquinone biosynthesis C-methylase UbiE